MKQDSIYLNELEDPAERIPVEDIDEFVACAGEEQRTCVLMFSQVRTEADIVVLLKALARSPRWRHCVVASDLPGVRVGLEWQTAEGKWSSCMGLAPLFSMPPTRRAPYVGIALWPGCARISTGEQVGFIDIPSGLGQDEHKKTLASTSAFVKAVFTEPPEPWRHIAFCLDEMFRPALPER